jgi:predicted GNAT family N-acyltransferase
MMPYREIPDVSALPASEPHSEHIAVATRKETYLEYLRLLSDQTLLQCQRTGQIFVRRDGRDWEHAAVRVWREKDNSTRAEPRPAWGDIQNPGRKKEKKGRAA